MSTPRPHPLSNIVNALALVILLVGFAFAATQCSRCEHEQRMGQIEEQQARALKEAP
jgi:hypothetical protein